MALTEELEQFITNWLNRADQPEDNNWSASFDKFFTLYVVFNRLYAEATFVLAKTGQVDPDEWDYFPDHAAATDYLCQYLSSSAIVDTLRQNHQSAESLLQIMKLIQDGRFFIVLDMVTGERQRDKDLELLADLASRNRGKKATAILELIYSIRCNMFHGHKGFEEVQADLLNPVNNILRKVIEILHDKLSREPS